MIAKSDLVILAVSASLLIAGIYRWQTNVAQSGLRNTTASIPSRNQAVAQPRTDISSVSAKPVLPSDDTGSAPAAEINASIDKNFGDTSQFEPLSQTPSAAREPEIPVTATSMGNSAGQPLYGNYEVQPGDSLSRIADLYGTTVDTLRNINDISGSLITVGQNLLYPLPAN